LYYYIGYNKELQSRYASGAQQESDSEKFHMYFHENGRDLLKFDRNAKFVLSLKSSRKAVPLKNRHFSTFLKHTCIRAAEKNAKNFAFQSFFSTSYGKKVYGKLWYNFC